MSYSYNYTLSDFNGGKFESEIVWNSNISSTVIALNHHADTLTVVFAVEPTTQELVILQQLVDEHNPDDSCYRKRWKVEVFDRLTNFKTQIRWYQDFINGEFVGLASKEDLYYNSFGNMLESKVITDYYADGKILQVKQDQIARVDTPNEILLGVLIEP